MAFSDPRYPVFLALVGIILGWLPAGKARLLFVTAAGLYFSSGLGATALVMPLVGILGYLGGLAMVRTPEGKGRPLVFGFSLLLVLTPLLLCKYAQPALIALGLGWTNWVLPVGISFYTFMAAGYLIDVYVGNIDVVTSPLRFAAFLSFFPQLTAGPIGRSYDFLPQLERLGQFNYARALTGLKYVLLGTFMKVVIADSLAPLVEIVYSDPLMFGRIDLILATLYFSFQVYADFAGYSYIAIGSAKLLGIDLQANFQQPYLSQNLPEYWRRWHISLSSWFRDYVFVPLQFNVRRQGSKGLVAALVFTFVLVGVWHGAGWKYALFGLIHGILVAFSTLTFTKFTKRWKSYGLPSGLVAFARIVMTFLTIATTFVLFRAQDVVEAALIYQRIFDWNHSLARSLPIIAPTLAIFILIAGDLLASRKWSTDQLPQALRWGVYYLVCLLISEFTLKHIIEKSRHAQEFIYFKF